MLKRNILLSIIFTISILFKTNVSFSQDFEKALELVTKAADNICGRVTTDGESNTASIGVELDVLNKKLWNMGIKGDGKYETKNYKGISQSDLVLALKDSNNCRLQIFNSLQKLFDLDKNRDNEIDVCKQYNPPFRCKFHE